MALLDILTYPDPRLRTVAKPVVEFDAALSQLVKDMAETMYAAPGIGLAATQINAHKRLIVIDISEEKNDLLVLINPEIMQAEGEVESDEGCLSVPDIYAPVKRAEKVKIYPTITKTCPKYPPKGFILGSHAPYTIAADVDEHQFFSFRGLPKRITYMKAVKTILVAGSLLLSANVAMADGQAVFNGGCAACHATGVAGAPKVGDKAAWADRVKQDIAVLHEHALKGFQGSSGVMPPKGGFMNLSDEEVMSAVDYMVEQGK